MVSKTNKFDFHMHTSHSYDSLNNPEFIIKSLLRKKLDGVAITDHNRMSGAFKLKKIAEKQTSLKIIIGCEFSTEYGDIIGLNIYENIKSNKFVDVFRGIKNQGGIVVLPHPYRYNNRLRVPYNFIKFFDFIEIFNSRSTSIQDKMAKFLADKNNIPIIAGSDAHNPWEVGNTFMEIPMEIDEFLNGRKSLPVSVINGQRLDRTNRYFSIILGKLLKILDKFVQKNENLIFRI